MLLKDKYKPLRFSESKLNDKTVNKLVNISTVDSFTNIFLYGPSGNGKYTQSQMLLESIYGKDIYYKTPRIFEYNINGNTKSIEILCSLYHYEILFNDNYSYDHNIIIEFLKDISSTMNILNNSFKVILMRNIQFLNAKMYDNIKTISERYSDNIKFIFISPSLINVPRYMFGFFSFIRIPKINSDAVYSYFDKICKKEKIKMGNSDKLVSLIERYNCNLNLIFATLELIKQNTNYNLIDPIESRYKKLVTLINKKDVTQIDKLRKELYDLTSCNINKADLIMYLFRKYIENMEHKNKPGFISFTNNILKSITHSYRDLFHIEYFIIHLMTL
jgi:DNA polymerase III delta prime subunit